MDFLSRVVNATWRQVSLTNPIPKSYLLNYLSSGYSQFKSTSTRPMISFINAHYIKHPPERGHSPQRGTPLILSCIWELKAKLILNIGLGEELPCFVNLMIDWYMKYIILFDNEKKDLYYSFPLRNLYN
jgi:hypothetical protein